MTSTQVKQPREFKFVGAYSRKRRARRAPNKKNTATASSTTTTPKPQDPKPISTPQDDTDHCQSTQECHPPERMGMPPQPTEQPPINEGMGAMPTIDALSPSGPGHGDDQGPIPQTAPDVDMATNLSEMPDWTYGSLMNPFNDIIVDFNTPFDPLGGQYQFPYTMGGSVMIPLDQLGEISPTSSSGRTHPQAEGEEGDATRGHEPIAENMPSLGEAANVMADEIVLPSLDINSPNGNISHTISQLLIQYDQEFCVLPLTQDFEANPFRFDPKTGRGSKLLLHCILAISYKHINRDTGRYNHEAKTHKRMAFQMLKDVEGETYDHPVQANLLDALLILMTLDCATSARGSWIWYLKRAHKMIQATETLEMQKTPRMQASIEMLVWWDVTLALTTRKGCVLSQSTILSLLDPNDSSVSTFYSVSGCPRDLFSYMVHLASYAREYELASTMTCVKFDLGPVLKVGKDIRQWKNPRFDDFRDADLSSVDYNEHEDEGTASDENESEETVNIAHYREDLYHCAEAWRYALLLYTERVFRWRGRPAPAPASKTAATSAVPARLGFLARRTLNHVSSCRRSSMLQKQLLLPVFLAGCETQDADLLRVASEYCSWWNEKTRYDMFLTAGALLEEIWALRDDETAWWGAILDQKARDNGNPSASRQYLFG